MNRFAILYKLFSCGRIVDKCRQFWVLYLFSKSLPLLFSVILFGLVGVVSLQAQTSISHNINTQGTLTIPGNSTNNYNITGTGTSTSNRVIIESGYSGTITLNNVMIKAPADYAAIRVKGLNLGTAQYNGNTLNPVTRVTIILNGYNQLESGSSTAGLKETAAGSSTAWSNAAALQVDMGAQIYIRAIDENDNNSGELVARSYHNSDGAAGIGGPNSNFGTTKGDSGPQGSVTAWGPNKTGSKYVSGGNIIISSGKIYARGGRCGAGIGSGYTTIFTGNIIVYGGDITSYGGNHSAGIGTGCPSGSGNNGEHSYTSSIISLPPAQIKATTEQSGKEGLAGANGITYINDPSKTLITVKTEDNEPNANIYLDLTETPNLVNIFEKLGIEFDLKKVKTGKTDASGIFPFRAQFEQNTTFFTDASSSKPATFGRPYMPVVTTVVGSVTNTKTVTLPLLGMNIAFTDYPSTPLEVGYTTVQAKQNAYRLKMEYKDVKQMTSVTFNLQDLGADFKPMTFYASNGTTVVSAPTTLNMGDVYYIDLPIKDGKPMGIYSEILQINGIWDGQALPGPIRRVGEQRVVYNDTDINTNIKVTASPNKFVTTYPTSNSVNLTLNINHTGNSITYNPLDVTAKYLVTTEPVYETALAATPLSSWSNLNVPANVSTDMVTPVSFSGKAKDTYYIHWYVISGVVYAHSGTITVPPRTYGAFGPYVIADPVTPGTISGNPSVCLGQTPSEIKGQLSTGGSGSFDYQWQMSTDGVNWINVGSNTANYTPAPLTVSPTYYRRLTTDKIYGGAALPSNNTFNIYIVNQGQTLYWKQTATNRNWNDPANWVDAGGVAQNIVPVSCTNVYIRGGSSNYPSLDPNVSPIDVYGSPVCHNITFGYGAELAYQHKLTYDSAYVQYNFGYYSTLTSGVQPTANKDGASGISMKRDQWYPLAAPLKKMASGDFAFGGYPFVWQALADVVSGADNFYSINFSKGYVNNDVDLSKTNNSIAVKAALYKTGVNTIGYSDHKNLQALQGVLQIPYFNNSSEAAYHPGHSYDPIAKRSTFYYFNNTTLQRLTSPVGRMDRGDKAFRFVIENDQDKVDIVKIDGVDVPCYTMTVSPNSTNKHALIGNPFMAAINMKNFYDVNATVLDNSGYYAYDNSGTGVWKNYTYTLGNGVNSLQSFAVVFKNSAANQILRFPLEGLYALTGSTTAKIPRRIEQTDALSVSIVNESGLGGDYTELAPANYILKTALTSDVRKLIGEESHTTPEVFFINRDKVAYNLMQIYNKDEVEVGLGVRYSDTESQLTLSFDKIQRFAELTGTTPLLVDKYMNVEQDLTQNNIYVFKQQLTAGNTKYTDASRFSIRLGDPLSTIDEGLDVIYQEGSLSVRSAKEITKVKVYNILGQLVFDSKILKDNNTYYRHSISLLKGSYVVRVNTIDGKSVSHKIVVTDN